jgi:glycosyltransferase involved in cell wall biosynthesis
MARVIFLSETYTTHDRRFLEKLSQSSHTVFFLPCVASVPPFESRPVPEGIRVLPPVLDKSLPWGWSDWRRAIKVFKNHVHAIQPDLVHAGPIPTGTLLAALAGFHPLLAMSWGSDILAPENIFGLQAWATRYALRRSDMALADCAVVQDRIMALSCLQNNHIVVFPWGVDLNRFHPGKVETALRKRFQVGEKPLIIHTRGFEPIHQPLLFLAAVERVRRLRPNTCALMLGDGSLHPQVEAYIESHGLKNSVFLTGRISNEELPDFYRAADLYVSTTQSDGSSISLLEAMASGLGVIAIDAYGNREWVIPGKNGWLFEPGNVETLAQLIIKTLDDESLRCRMKDANVALAREKADWDVNFQKLLTAYEQARSVSHAGV